MYRRYRFVLARWLALFFLAAFPLSAVAQIVDPQFDPGLGPDKPVHAIAVSSDQKIVVGGEFVTFDSVARTALVRLNTNGTVDPAFNAPVSGSESPLNAMITTIAFAPNGKIYIGGSFTNVAGKARRSIARLNPDGTLDATFAPALSQLDTAFPPHLINTLTIQADGKIIVNGRDWLARLNPDGSPDATFDPGRPISFGQSDLIRAVALDQQYGVLAGGAFPAWSTQPNAMLLVRLTENGSAEPTFTVHFNPLIVSTSPSGSLSFVSQILTTANGRILLHGGFASLAAGASLGTVTRVLASGESDPSFQSPNLTNDLLGFTSIALCPDGKILAGATNLTRLNEDGTVDSTFPTNITANAAIQVMALDASGNAIVAGDFTTIAGQSRHNIARIQMNLPMRPPIILVQPEDKTFDVGETLLLHGIAEASAFPITYQWQHYGTNIPGADGSSIGIPRSTKLSAGPYQLIISNRLGMVTSTVAQVMIQPLRNGPGAPNPDFLSAALPGGIVTSFAADLPGRVIVTGSNLVSQYSPAQVARFKLDGLLDPGNSLEFGPYSRGGGVLIPTGRAWSVTLLPGGKALIGGTFWARLNPDFSIDSSFAPGGTDGTLMGLSAEVKAILVQSSGRIVIGGHYSKYGAVSTVNIARLLPANGLDPSFHPPPAQPINAIIEDRNGLTVFGSSGGRAIFRLLDDGTLDPSFTAETLHGKVNAIAEQPNGSLIVGGLFNSASPPGRTNLIRLTAAGEFDPTFDPGAVDGAVNAVALQDDGKLLVGGEFTSIHGISRNHFARLMSTGTVDATFDPGEGADGSVNAIAMFPDGEILLGGSFSAYDHEFSPLLVRVHNDPRQFQSVLTPKGFQTSFRAGAGQSLFWERRRNSVDAWQVIQTIAGDNAVHTVTDIHTNASGFYRVRSQ